jgi:hypothetical protein
MAGCDGDPNIDVSGGGLTWTQETSDGSGAALRARSFSAVGDSGSASGFTLTIDANSKEWCYISVAIFDGVDTTDPIGITDRRTSNETLFAYQGLSGTGSGSWAIHFGVHDTDDWVDSPNTGYPATVCTNGLYSGESGGGANGVTYGLCYATSVGTSDVNYTHTALNSDQHIDITVEIKAEGAATEEMMLISEVEPKTRRTK